MFIKVSCIFGLLLSLTACDMSNKNQTTEQKKEEPAIAQVSSNESKDLAKVTKGLCDQVNLTQWSGFDEATEDAKCQPLKQYQLVSFHCDVSTNAFGLEQDAVLIENKEQRIFAYSTLEQCNQALDTRNSNGP